MARSRFQGAQIEEGIEQCSDILTKKVEKAAGDPIFLSNKGKHSIPYLNSQSHMGPTASNDGV